MKKSLKKLIALAITTTTLMAMPLYASSEKPTLSLEASIEAAITHSTKMSLNSKEYNMLKERLKSKEGGTFYAYQAAYLQKAQNQHQKEIIEDQITYDITNRYQNLILAEKELKNLDENISIKERELRTLTLQKDLGLISTTQYESAQIKLEDLKASKTAKLDTLKNDQDYFKLLTNKDVKEYILDDTLHYETFRAPGSIDTYLDSKIDTYLKYNKELVQLSKDNLLVEGSMPIPWSTYLDSKYTIEQQENNLETTKDTLKNNLMKNYSTLLSLEEQMTSLQTQLKLLEKQLATSKLQYEVGLQTALAYDTQCLNLNDLQYNLRKLMVNYNSLKTVIQKPWSAM